jgi:hypothetical protein
MHTLSIAEMVPPMLATHSIFSPHRNSRASPGGGSSDLFAIFTD